MKPYNAHMEIRTCHDIRRLETCSHCKGIGDRAMMLRIGEAQSFDYLHGRCFIELNGLSAFLSLPTNETDNLTLADIGLKAMKLLMRHRT